MILNSILIDNIYGNNISRIIFYGDSITNFEVELLKNNKFYIEIDKNNKNFIQQKIENLITENNQVAYLNQLIKFLQDKYYILFSFQQDFFIVWKDKNTTKEFKGNLN